MTVRGHGVVFHNSGRVVNGADGTIEFLAGKSGVLDYFVNGNTSAIAELCSVLEA